MHFTVKVNPSHLLCCMCWLWNKCNLLSLGALCPPAGTGKCQFAHFAGQFSCVVVADLLKKPKSILWWIGLLRFQVVWARSGTTTCWSDDICAVPSLFGVSVFLKYSNLVCSHCFWQPIWEFVSIVTDYC